MKNHLFSLVFIFFNSVIYGAFEQNGFRLGIDKNELSDFSGYKELEVRLSGGKGTQRKVKSLIKSPDQNAIYWHYLIEDKVSAYKIILPKKSDYVAPLVDQGFEYSSTINVLQSDNLAKTSIEALEILKRGKETLLVLDNKRNHIMVLFDQKHHSISDFFVLSKEKERLDTALKATRERVGMKEDSSKVTQIDSEQDKQSPQLQSRPEKPLLVPEQTQTPKIPEREPKPSPETSSSEADKPASFPWWLLGIMGLIVVLSFIMLKSKSK